MIRLGHELAVDPYLDVKLGGRDRDGVTWVHAVTNLPTSQDLGRGPFTGTHRAVDRAV